MLPDNLMDRAAQDRARISMTEEHEVHYWTQVFGVSKDRLASIVARVGNSAEAVRREKARVSGSVDRLEHASWAPIAT